MFMLATEPNAFEKAFYFLDESIIKQYPVINEDNVHEVFNDSLIDHLHSIYPHHPRQDIEDVTKTYLIALSYLYKRNLKMTDIIQTIISTVLNETMDHQRLMLMGLSYDSATSFMSGTLLDDATQLCIATSVCDVIKTVRSQIDEMVTGEKNVRYHYHAVVKKGEVNFDNYLIDAEDNYDISNILKIIFEASATEKELLDLGYRPDFINRYFTGHHLVKGQLAAITQACTMIEIQYEYLSRPVKLVPENIVTNNIHLINSNHLDNPSRRYDFH